MNEYDFNVCIECQKRNKDVPCNKTCKYLKEYKTSQVNENKVPTCIECGEPMVNDIDSVTKKISKYLWKTTCGHGKNLRLSRG